MLKSNIENLLEKEYVPLTTYQRNMWFDQCKQPEDPYYNIGGYLEINGDVEHRVFEESINQLISDNDALRITIENQDGQPFQRFISELTYKVELNDFSSMENAHDYIMDWMHIEFLKPFKMENDILFEFHLIKEKDNLFYFFAKCHHLIMDGWGFSVLGKKIKNIYNELIKGEKFDDKCISYIKFVEEHLNYINSEKYKSDTAFWRDKFKEMPEPILPKKKDLNSKDNFITSGRKTLTIKRESYDRIIDLCTERGYSIFNFFLGITSIYFSKVYAKEELVIGVPIHNRRSKIQKTTLGLFMNVIPIRVQIGSCTNFTDLLSEIKKELRECYRHQQLSLGEILSVAGNGYSDNESLYELFFSYMKHETSEQFNDFDTRSVMLTNQNEKKALSISVSEFSDIQDVKIDFDYRLDIFDSVFSIDNVIEHFNNLISDILNNCDQNIAETEFISEREKEKILFEFNNSKQSYCTDKLVHQLFEEQVEKTPENIAVSFMDRSLTYRELNNRSNRLARVLRANDISSNVIVGIMVDRSLDMLVGILAIMKAGGAYLPIDPTYPKDRINYMLHDSAASILLTQTELLDGIEFIGDIVSIENMDNSKFDNINLEPINKITDLVYVIYTSGTTGKPKGVMVEHQNFLNISYAWKEEYNLEQMDIRLLQMASFAFDVFSGDLSRTLFNGGEMIICPSDVRMDPRSLYALIIKHRINIFESTPSLIIPLMDYIDENNLLLDSLELLIIGSDSISMETFEKLNEKFGSTMRIINSYGVTEATIDSSYYEKKENNYNVAGDTPIGKPLPNTTFYILNNNGLIQPIGVYGELFIGGAGVSRGYLNKPEVTNEKFRTNPFISGETMYRTGDLARWLPDGNIEFLGRIDNQVKIRGYRIELGEIESVLESHPDVKEAVVVPWEGNTGDKYLCGYLTVKDMVHPDQLKDYISEILPYFMVPARFVILEQIPLTPNGKVDRKSLPKPDDFAALVNRYYAPTNKTEEELIRIWGEILNVEKLGIKDNFFELGGHSLNISVMVSKVHKAMNVQVPISEAFKLPTIEKLAKYITASQKNIYSLIKPLEEKEYYPASSAQKRLYIISQLQGALLSYNMPEAIILEGVIDRERFEQAFQSLVQRHESLRTSFEIVDEEVVQKIHQDLDFCVDFEKIEDGDIKGLMNNFVKPFELSKAPLMRVKLVQTDSSENILLFDMHHIVSDGISMAILINEFIQLYEGKSLIPLKIQYKDYASWRNTLSEKESMKVQQEYWAKLFQNDVPVLNISTDYPRPPMKSFEGSRIEYNISAELTLRLKSLAKNTGTTLFMVLLAAYNVLLSRYSGQEDIVVGTPIAGRPHPDFENIIGMFVNTLALRNYPSHNKEFNEFLTEVRENSLIAYENQDYQFEDLIDKLSLKRDLSRNPLFDAMFVMQNTGVSLDNISSFSLTQAVNQNTIAKFDMTLTAVESKDSINLDMEYSTSLFKKETMERLLNHYVNILDKVTTEAQLKIGEINLLTEYEKNQLLFVFNDTKSNYSKNKTIHSLFEEQVLKTPDNIAVTFDGNTFSYKQLNEKANNIARLLRENGVGRDKIVAIMVERSIEMIAGILGILKSGGTFLPVDPTYPEDRINYMLNDSKTGILITQKRYIGQFQQRDSLVLIDLENEDLYEVESSNLSQINQPEDVAYVIYTSGSTGNPKGVMIQHFSVINRLNWMQKQYPIGEKDVLLQKTNYTFDVSVWELLWGNLQGAKTHFLKPGGEKDPEEIIKAIDKHQVTTMHFVPSMMNIFLDYIEDNIDNVSKIKSLRQVFASGEALSVKQVNHFNRLLHRTNNTKLHNLYGPTEATVDVTYFDCSKDETLHTVPIGKPIDNTELYVVDKFNNLQPVGVPGELCISGDGVGKGYINNPTLSEEKFVMNPFNQGQIMYRTGDLVRWLSDGNIEYLGRIDRQVKIRGFRIELGEIESQLLKNEHVKEAVITSRNDDKGEKYLCAYIVCKKDINLNQFKEQLLKQLPNYMIPSVFVKLDTMPLTTNGKVNVKELPLPVWNIGEGNVYVAPRNAMEQKLAKLWEDVLGIKKVGLDDNFFELGGHSLKAAVLASKIHKELHIKISLNDILLMPVFRVCADFIAKGETRVFKSIEPVEKKDFYPVSSAQKRLFIMDQFNGGTAYNVPGGVFIEGFTDLNIITRAINALVARHESLRTSFNIVEGETVQRVHDQLHVVVNYVESSAEVFEETLLSLITPFDLSCAPLLRVWMLKLEEDKHLLFLDTHHIIADGISIQILIKEFEALIMEKELPQLRIQYKDFSSWQNEFQRTGMIKEQEQYWLELFNDEVPVLHMPTDYARPAIQSFEGASLTVNISSELESELNAMTTRTETTMYMIMFAAFNVLLAKYTGDEDIVVGSSIAGRKHDDLNNVIGMFVNTLPMRNKLVSEQSFNDFLINVKSNALKAYANQDYQFEELVEKLNLHRDMGRSPLFDVMFDFHNEVEVSDDESALTLKPYSIKQQQSKFDIALEVYERQNTLELRFDYCTKLFDKSTIERLAMHYVNVLQEVTVCPDIIIKEIEIMSEEERKEILSTYNHRTVFPEDKTVVTLFEDAVRLNPHKIAVQYGSVELTYEQLNKQANQLARFFLRKGVQGESLVGIMLERSPLMLSTILGIWKAGGAYIPIDHQSPATRVNNIIKDSGALLLVTSTNLLNEEIRDAVGKSIVEINTNDYLNEDVNDLEVKVDPRNLAYVIYTSGSTGKPKGAMVEHIGMLNHICAKTNDLQLDHECVIAQNASASFDISVWQMFTALILLGKTVIYNDEFSRDPKELFGHATKDKVTVLEVVPSLLSVALDYLESEVETLGSLKYLMVTGETVKPSLVKRWFSLFPAIQMVNAYGPTEASDDITHFIMDHAPECESISIGKPIQNMNIYIVDKNMKLCPPGIKGEICVSGIGVGRGYLNDPKKTDAVFTKDPFVSNESLRLYKTGDIGRWLTNGNIEFFGRKDYQVKIRGYRVELEEIENNIANCYGVKEAVVIDKENGSDDDKYLCAYIVFGDYGVDITDVREELRTILPSYMIPTYFIPIERLPLTPNGKVDRKALPEPKINVLEKLASDVPENSIEKELSEIWKEVLNVNSVGINDNFFEMGGHSLKAVLVSSKIQKVLATNISLQEIFRYPTIKELAKRIELAENNEYLSIQSVDKREYYPLSSAQLRVYLAYEMEGASVHYNIPGAVIIEGDVDILKYNAALQQLMGRHESLRTSFGVINGEPVQYIHEELGFNLDVLETSEEKLDETIQALIKPFELGKAPLMRAAIIRLNQERHVFFIDMHHIVSDGVSIENLTKELVSILRGDQLPELKVDYKDFVFWQNRLFSNSGKLDQQKKYWLNIFKGDLPLLNMKTDFPRNEKTSYAGSTFKVEVDSMLRNNIYELTANTGTTLNTVLLAALNVLFYRYTGQEDIIVGSVTSGRSHVDLQNLVGMFVNTLALRNNPSGDKTFIQFLNEIKESSLEAYENQDYQFEMLVKDLGLKRVIGRNPIFDIALLIQNNEDSTVLEDLKITPYPISASDAKFDLTLIANERFKTLELGFQYRTQLYAEETIERMALHFVHVLRSIVDNPQVKLSDIDLLSEEQKQRVTVATNQLSDVSDFVF